VPIHHTFPASQPTPLGNPGQAIALPELFAEFAGGITNYGVVNVQVLDSFQIDWQRLLIRLPEHQVCPLRTVE
jgi:hypothetical protein